MALIASILAIRNNVRTSTSCISASSTLPSREVASLAWNDLSLVKPGLLAEAVSKVEEEIDLRNSCLTTQQTEAIFGALESSGQKPRKVCLRHNDMSEADADVLAGGAHEVEEMDLRHTSITNQSADLDNHRTQPVQYEAEEISIYPAPLVNLTSIRLIRRI